MLSPARRYRAQDSAWPPLRGGRSSEGGALGDLGAAGAVDEGSPRGDRRVRNGLDGDWTPIAQRPHAGLRSVRLRVLPGLRPSGRALPDSRQHQDQNGPGMSAPDSEGLDRLGPYTSLSKLGAGGMGEVYLARDPRLERKVAIKLLPQALRGDPERRLRLLREARAVAQLSHPHITDIHEVGEAEGHDFIAFEYVDGRTLAEPLAERRPSLPTGSSRTASPTRFRRPAGSSMGSGAPSARSETGPPSSRSCAASSRGACCALGTRSCGCAPSSSSASARSRRATSPRADTTSSPSSRPGTGAGSPRWRGPEPRSPRPGTARLGSVRSSLRGAAFRSATDRRRDGAVDDLVPECPLSLSERAALEVLWFLDGGSSLEVRKPPLRWRFRRIPQVPGVPGSGGPVSVMRILSRGGAGCRDYKCSSPRRSRNIPPVIVVE